MTKSVSQYVGLIEPGIAATQSGIELLRGMLDEKYPAPPSNETSGIWPLSFEVGRVVFEGQPSARFYNPMGTVHGGWISTLLDTAMACAVQSSLAAGQRYTTIEMKTVFVKPVHERTGALRCEGVLLHAGRRVAHAEGKVFDQQGNLIAYGSETCQISEIKN